MVRRSIMSLPLISTLLLPLLLLAQLACCGSASKIATPITSSATSSSYHAHEAQDQRQRRLDLEKLAGYQPMTIVTDEAAIDLDADAIAKELAARSRTSAEAIYIKGAYSKSVATLRLDAPLPIDVTEGTPLVGLGVGAAGLVQGYALNNHATGSETIRFVYSAIDDQANYMMCRVGASPTPVLDRCLQENGFLEVKDYYTRLSYKYSVLNGTVNARSLEGFSRTAQENFASYDEFLKYYIYYGRYDYADHWIKSAFEAQSTTMNNGNAPFAILSDAEVHEATSMGINSGILLLSVWMEIIGNLNKALDVCNAECAVTPNSGCNDRSAHQWEQSVAYYVGSLQGENGLGPGIMLYEHAERMCANFNTCEMEPDGSEVANANRQVLHYFELGREAIDKGECNTAVEHKNAIVLYMTIPLVQHVIKMAYELETAVEPTETTKVEAATAAAALLPLIHNCSVDDAAYVYDRMRLDSTFDSIRASDIKSALERNYNCLELLCEDVGGLVNSPGGVHIMGLGTCNDADLKGYSSGRSGNDVDDGLIVGLVFGGMLLVTLGVFGIMRFCGGGISTRPGGAQDLQIQGGAVPA